MFTNSPELNAKDIADLFLLLLEHAEVGAVLDSYLH